MNYRLTITAVAVALAASSLAICAEELSKDVVKVNELLGSVRKMIEEEKLDAAETQLDSALEEFWNLPEKDRANVDRRSLTAPFDLAEKLKEAAKDDEAKTHALKWYEAYARVRRLYDWDYELDDPNPSFYGKQKEYAYVLDMALRECGCDPDKLRRKYPYIAESWAPPLAADLDGDGTKEFVALHYGKLAPTDVSVFFMKGKGGMQMVRYVYDGCASSVSVSDEDGDGKDEILLELGPPHGRLIHKVSRDGMIELDDWVGTVVTLKYKDGKLMKEGGEAEELKEKREE